MHIKKKKLYWSRSPNVGLRSKYAVQEALGWHPFYGQHRLAAFPIIIASINVPGHTEIRDLNGTARCFGSQQAIPSGDISVYKTRFLHIFTAVCDVVAAHNKV